MVLPNETLLDALRFLDYVALEAAALANSALRELFYENVSGLARRRVFEFGERTTLFNHLLGFRSFFVVDDDVDCASPQPQFSDRTALSARTASSVIGPHPITAFLFDPEHMTFAQLQEIFAFVQALSRVHSAENDATLSGDHKTDLDGLLQRLGALQRLQLTVDAGFEELLRLECLAGVPAIYWKCGYPARRGFSLSSISSATEKRSWTTASSSNMWASTTPGRCTSTDSACRSVSSTAFSRLVI